jgi:UDP-glucose 4-epimerase
VTGHTVPTRLAPRRAGDPPELVADPKLAESRLRWKAKRSLEEIISTAWNWAQKTSAVGARRG